MKSASARASPRTAMSGDRRPLVEALRQQSIVLEVIDRTQETRRDPVVGVAEDRFVDLNLLRAGDFAVVRLEARGVGVVVVAVDRSVRRQASRFEDRLAAAVADREMKPGAPRGIGGRQLVARQVFDSHVNDQPCPSTPPHGRWISAPFVPGATRACRWFRRSSSAGRAATSSSDRYRFSIRSMKKLPPTERVATHVVAFLAEDRGDPRLLLNDGHVTMPGNSASSLYSLCCHSRNGTCSGSRPIAWPSGPRAVV